KLADAKIERKQDPTNESNLHSELLDDATDTAPSQSSIASILYRSHEKRPKSGYRKTAIVLPTIFPADLEVPMQPIMEGIFGAMREELQYEIQNLSKPDVEGEQNRLREARKLLETLLSTVSKGWYLSRSDGHEAILRDSFDLNDFLERQGAASADSYLRVSAWRDFVEEYLNFFDAQLLCVSLDDTDVDPSVTADILYTIRIFLDHPRIVTLLAGHLRSMRHSLLLRDMEALNTAIQTLGTTEESTPQEWRRFTRQQIEEYLEKILPRANRFFLVVKTTTRQQLAQSRIKRQKAISDSGGDDTDKLNVSTVEQARVEQVTDFQAVTGETFYDFCSNRLRDQSDDFHDCRFAAYTEVFLKLRNHDAPPSVSAADPAPSPKPEP
ncbi:MAG: hypothetical protein AAFY15_14255, partial [Cyanobacteria bacterium J06648_11]